MIWRKKLEALSLIFVFPILINTCEIRSHRAANGLGTVNLANLKKNKVAKIHNQAAEQMLCSNDVRGNNLKDAIISELASKSPSMAINHELIHLRLQQFLPTFQTPSHPPYSSMIRQALLKLNEECGSTEEDISRNLEKEFEGLPWAHASFLSHHLEKLCGNGELVRVGNERYMVNSDDDDDVGKEDRALVQGKGDQASVVNGVQGVESENRCEVERQIVEASGLNRTCEGRMEGFEEQIEGGMESIKEVREESQFEASHHLEKLCENREIICINNELDTVCMDDRDLGNKEEMSHRLNISNSDEKEDQTLVQVKEREVEAINDDQAVETENQCEDETHSMEVMDQNKASEQRTEGSVEQNECRSEPLKEVQRESRNISGKIEVAEEVDVAKGKLTKGTRKRRGQKRKRQQKSKLQIKDDIPEPMMEAGERPQKMKRGSGVKKSAGEQEQPQKIMRGSGVKRSAGEQKQSRRMLRGSGLKKSAGEQEQSSGSGLKISAGEQMLPSKMRLRSGVKKSASEQEQPRRGKMIGEQGWLQDSKINIRTKKRSMRLSEKQKKEGLKHEEPRKRNLHDRERDMFIVCALPATWSRTNMDLKAHTLLIDSRPADLRGNMSERFTRSEPKPNGTSKELEEKQEQQFHNPKKLGKYKMKTKQATFGCEEAEDSMDQGHQAKSIKVYARRT